ncbi:hypothetical protein AOT83_01185 [Mycobacteroides sp. H001]|nr:hypothetical protein AOT83_01185 [Mycobacteroides sp. H001]
MTEAHSLLEVTLFVSDPNRSAEFYRALGITLFENCEPGCPTHYDGGVGEVVLQLWPSLERPISKVQLGLRATDIGAVSLALDGLGIGYELPGPRRLRAFDPDGNRVHLSDV